ncbi:hypothetical protein DFQ28_002159 [Apophysomyces sp. BC1034]|nr:hypothetical protein DFQ29_001641 [Apophysomyces sp. BC1021]KAG0190380.1 hypothetical protein DFQ28_002159 [Apophysomyces sp. BC1034]
MARDGLAFCGKKASEIGRSLVDTNGTSHRETGQSKKRRKKETRDRKIYRKCTRTQLRSTNLTHTAVACREEEEEKPKVHSVMAEESTDHLNESDWNDVRENTICNEQVKENDECEWLESAPLDHDIHHPEEPTSARFDETMSDLTQDDKTVETPVTTDDECTVVESPCLSNQYVHYQPSRTWYSPFSIGLDLDIMPRSNDPLCHYKIDAAPMSEQQLEFHGLYPQLPLSNLALLQSHPFVNAKKSHQDQSHPLGPIGKQHNRPHGYFAAPDKESFSFFDRRRHCG